MAAKKSVELQTLDLICELLPILKELGISSLYPGTSVPVHLDWGHAAKAAIAAGADMTVAYHQPVGTSYYTAEFIYKGVRIRGCIDPKELPSLGYTVAEDGQPVPIHQPAVSAV